MAANRDNAVQSAKPEKDQDTLDLLRSPGKRAVLMRGDFGDAVTYVRERVDEKLLYHFQNNTAESQAYRTELARAIQSPLGRGESFGFRTEGHVNLLQRIEGLTMIDGKVGMETITALDKQGLSVSSPSEARDFVEAQRKLAKREALEARESAEEYRMTIPESQREQAQRNVVERSAIRFGLSPRTAEAAEPPEHYEPNRRQRTAEPARSHRPERVQREHVETVSADDNPRWSNRRIPGNVGWVEDSPPKKEEGWQATPEQKVEATLIQAEKRKARVNSSDPMGLNEQTVDPDKKHKPPTDETVDNNGAKWATKEEKLAKFASGTWEGVKNIGRTFIDHPLESIGAVAVVGTLATFAPAITGGLLLAYGGIAGGISLMKAAQKASNATTKDEQLDAWGESGEAVGENAAPGIAGALLRTARAARIAASLRGAALETAAGQKVSSAVGSVVEAMEHPRFTPKWYVNTRKHFPDPLKPEPYSFADAMQRIGFQMSKLDDMFRLKPWPDRRVPTHARDVVENSDNFLASSLRNEALVLRHAPAGTEHRTHLKLFDSDPTIPPLLDKAAKIIDPGTHSSGITLTADETIKMKAYLKARDQSTFLARRVKTRLPFEELGNSKEQVAIGLLKIADEAERAATKGKVHPISSFMDPAEPIRPELLRKVSRITNPKLDSGETLTAAEVASSDKFFVGYLQSLQTQNSRLEHAVQVIRQHMPILKKETDINPDAFKVFGGVRAKIKNTLPTATSADHTRFGEVLEEIAKREEKIGLDPPLVARLRAHKAEVDRTGKTDFGAAENSDIHRELRTYLETAQRKAEDAQRKIVGIRSVLNNRSPYSTR